MNDPDSLSIHALLAPDASKLRSLQAALARDGVVFLFNGLVSEKILFALGDALRQKVQLETPDINTVNRVFSVFVEQVQNVIRYSAERVRTASDPPGELSEGIIAVGRSEDRFFVSCGNVVSRADADGLRQRLAELATLDAAALKKRYREKLREPPEEGSKGASIGLLEIARRASAPIEFDVTEINGDVSFFAMKAYI
ncbi:MAG: SiaB family protein kinase [Thioalkalivibrionaceae bacterium]